MDTCSKMATLNNTSLPTPYFPTLLARIHPTNGTLQGIPPETAVHRQDKTSSPCRPSGAGSLSLSNLDQPGISRGGSCPPRRIPQLSEIITLIIFTGV